MTTKQQKPSDAFLDLYGRLVRKSRSEDSDPGILGKSIASVLLLSDCPHRPDYREALWDLTTATLKAVAFLSRIEELEPKTIWPGLGKKEGDFQGAHKIDHLRSLILIAAEGASYSGSRSLESARKILDRSAGALRFLGVSDQELIEGLASRCEAPVGN